MGRWWLEILGAVAALLTVANVVTCRRAQDAEARVEALGERLLRDQEWIRSQIRSRREDLLTTLHGVATDQVLAYAVAARENPPPGFRFERIAIDGNGTISAFYVAEPGEEGAHLPGSSKSD